LRGHGLRRSSSSTSSCASSLLHSERPAGLQCIQDGKRSMPSTLPSTTRLQKLVCRDGTLRHPWRMKFFDLGVCIYRLSRSSRHGWVRMIRLQMKNLEVERLMMIGVADVRNFFAMTFPFFLFCTNKFGNNSLHTICNFDHHLRLILHSVSKLERPCYYNE